MAFKKMTKISLVLIIIILIVNIFIIYNQANQIRDLTKWVEAVSDRQLRGDDYVNDRVELLEAQIKTHEVDLNLDYDNIKWLTDELRWLNFFYYNHLECYSELMTILYDEGLIDDNFCDGVD